jgi:hypothetical protein
MMLGNQDTALDNRIDAREDRDDPPAAVAARQVGSVGVLFLREAPASQEESWTRDGSGTCHPPNPDWRLDDVAQCRHV